MSRVRRSGLGVGLKFFGRSVNGTRTSSSAIAGMPHSDAIASRLVAANPLRTVSLRVMDSAMLCLQLNSDLLSWQFYLLQYRIASDGSIDSPPSRLYTPYKFTGKARWALTDLRLAAKGAIPPLYNRRCRRLGDRIRTRSPNPSSHTHLAASAFVSPDLPDRQVRLPDDKMPTHTTDSIGIAANSVCPGKLPGSLRGLHRRHGCRRWPRQETPGFRHSRSGRSPPGIPVAESS